MLAILMSVSPARTTYVCVADEGGVAPSDGLALALAAGDDVGNSVPKMGEDTPLDVGLEATGWASQPPSIMSPARITVLDCDCTLGRSTSVWYGAFLVRQRHHNRPYRTQVAPNCTGRRATVLARPRRP